MKKWLSLLLGGLVILGVGLWGESSGVQFGKGYLIIGRGVRVLDKASLDQAVMAGREAAGFYRPYLIVLAREGLVSQKYGLWAVDPTTKEPMTGCSVPKTYLARSLSVVRLETDENRYIAKYGVGEAKQRLNRIVLECWAFGVASGERSEAFTRVRNTMEETLGETIVFGGGQ